MNRPNKQFDSLIHRNRFIVHDLSRTRIICPGAETFEQDCQALLYETRQRKEDLLIVQGALRVLESLFIEWLEQAPAPCLRHLAPKQDFVCGLTAFYESYHPLAKLERELINDYLAKGYTASYRGMTFGQHLKERK